MGSATGAAELEKNMITIEQQMNTKEKRRLSADDRYMDRMEKRWDAADALIGELCREGKKVFYINLMPLTKGKTKEGSRSEFVSYLIRNNYA